MELNNRQSYPELCFRVLEDLEARLPDHLTYHRIEHTIDVANVCDHYIHHYGISGADAALLRIAAIAHDYGYIQGPEGHEERSVALLSPLLEKEYSPEDMARIAGMIRATRVPQNPRNLYEQIVADADLDYLGRGDYAPVSEALYQEFLHFGVVENRSEWLDLQIRFLEQHQYHTDWAVKHRSETKKAVLKGLLQQRDAEG